MIPERLRQARLAFGLTLDALSERMTSSGFPITKAGLSKYELGKSTPPQSLLVHLAKILDVKVSYFYQDRAVEVSWIAFRKTAKMSAKLQEQVKAYATRVIESQLWLQQLIFPEEKVHFIPEMRVTNFSQAEEAASELRDAWDLGTQPIDSLTTSMESNGGVVVPCRDINAVFDGLSGKANEKYPVAIVSTQVSDDRKRFSLAHEIGHLVMRCEGLESAEEERLANRFASSLLVPADIARHELGTKRKKLEIRELGLLKKKYGLSMQGWARRALDLGIIEQSHFTSLCIVFSKNHWRHDEPIKFHAHEEPTKLRQMTLRAYAEGLISEGRAENLCPGAIKTAMKSEAPSVFSAAYLRKLPRSERQKFLAMAADQACEVYESNPQFGDFEAFGEDDVYERYFDTQKG